MKDQVRAKAQQLAQEFVQQGDATGWFERLYAEAQGNEQAIYWAQMVSNPNLVHWLDRRNVGGKGRRALVIGCGLGDDAENRRQVKPRPSGSRSRWEVLKRV